MRIQTKTIGPKAYNNLTVERKALCLCNIDSFDYDYWESLGLSERQADNLAYKHEVLDDDKWLVIGISA